MLTNHEMNRNFKINNKKLLSKADTGPPCETLPATL